MWLCEAGKSVEKVVQIATKKKKKYKINGTGIQAIGSTSEHDKGWEMWNLSKKAYIQKRNVEAKLDWIERNWFAVFHRNERLTVWMCKYMHPIESSLL